MKPLLLLHGAIGCSSQLIPFQKEFLKSNHQVFLFDFPGHGGKEFSCENFSIQCFSEAVLSFLDEKKISRVDIFGYSMGGYVALYLARHFSNRVGTIVTLGTKWEWSEEIAAKEIKMLNAEKILEKVPKFAEALKNNHAPNDWKIVLQKTAMMMQALGKNPELKDEDFLKIENKILLMRGENDVMVSKEETECVSEKLKNAEMKIIANTPHPIEQVDLKYVQGFAQEFFS